MVERALARVIADRELYTQWLGPVDAAIGELVAALPDNDEAAPPVAAVERLEAFAEQIPELLEAMRWDGLAEAIADAMFAADANGRLERAERLFRSEDRAALAGETPDADYLLEPATFDAAQRWFGRKVNLPTTLSSRELSLQLPAGMRNQAFFSAGVASTNVLGSLRENVEAIARGEIGYGEAKDRLTKFLAAEGYGIPLPGSDEDRDMRDIASLARLELVLRQNVGMAQAIGQRAVSEHPYAVERYPNYRYIANTDRHAKYDGMVLPKNHPAWRTLYPPVDFNCLCLVVDEDAPENTQGGGDLRETDEGGQVGRLERNGRVINVEPSRSGFVFRSSPDEAFADFDFSLIEDPEMRAVLERAMAERA